MQVDHASTRAATFGTDAYLRGTERAAQSVFTAVLESVGRQGYASAEELPDDVVLSQDTVRQAWNDWFSAASLNQSFDKLSRQDMKQQFGDLMVRAYSEGGYAAPQQFLASLSSEELEVVQHSNRLVDPIDVDSLTEEGALNLLLPQAAKVDLNHDGFQQTGIAMGMSFPNSDTPPEVVAAWDEATAGLDFGDRMFYEMQMMLPMLISNIVTDENGQFVRMIEPGDPDFTNPMASGNYSYRQAAADALEGVEFAKRWMTREQYEEQRDFWTNFGQLLDKHDAN
ncbi:hypothetical protein [Aeoliella mucimassa]|nr:hypothetical protein [Aeoliella mucimassa]